MSSESDSIDGWLELGERGEPTVSPHLAAFFAAPASSLAPAAIDGPRDDTEALQWARQAREHRATRRAKRARQSATLELYGPERSEDRQAAAEAMQEQLTARFGAADVPG